MSSSCFAGDAHIDGSKDWTKHVAANKRPCNNVVDEHEFSRTVLVDGTISSDFLFPSLSAETTLSNVATWVSTVSTEPPDDSGDPPGKSSAASAAAEETTAEAAEGGADHHEDGREASGSARSKDLDEAPEEPRDEALVDVGNLSCLGRGGWGLIGEECLLTVFVESVPSFLVGIVERIYAQVDNKYEGQDWACGTKEADDAASKSS